MKSTAFLILIRCLVLQTSMSQIGTRETDTELWLKAGAEFKLGERWTFALE